MGLFYANLDVYGPDHAAITSELRRQGRDAYVSPTFRGHTVVFDKVVDTQDMMAIEALGTSVTKSLSCTAIAAALHDDDVLYLWLFDRGEVCDWYDSCPSYFDEAGADQPTGGDAPALSAAFGCPDRADRVEQLLRADPLNDERAIVPGEQERHAAIAAELGCPRFVAGLGYSAIEGGYVAEEFSGVPFERV